MQTRRSLTALPLLITLVAATAMTHCSSSAPRETVGEVEVQSLDGPGKAMCSTLQSIGSASVGPISLSAKCNSVDYDNLYYLGSISSTLETVRRYGTVMQWMVESPDQRPDALSNALYCAIGYSDALGADGTVSALGGMGIRSRLHMTKRNPAGVPEVAGQRIGTLVIFGVAADIEDQDFDVTFPTEIGRMPSAPPLTQVSNQGYYMDLKTSAVTWDLSGSGSIDPIQLDIDFGQNNSFVSLNNGGVVFNPAGQVNAPSSNALFDFRYPVREGVCAACEASCANDKSSFCSCPSDCQGAILAEGSSCACPSAAETAQEACTNCSQDFGNLGDQQLPYYGSTGGAAGPYFYPDTVYNWFHFGTPGIATVDAEPFAATPAANPTTHFNAEFGFSLGVVTLGIGVNLSFRDSFVVAQDEEVQNENIDGYGTVKTALDAQSSASVTAHLILDFPMPFISHPILDLKFDILPETPTSEAQGHTTGANILYDYTLGNPITDFRVGSTEESMTTCLTAPPATSPPIQPGNPASFANAVANAGLQQLHPCNVDICLNGNQHQTCQWDASTQKLVCVNAPGACNACASTAQLCNAQGQPYAPASETRPGSCTPIP